MFALRVRGVPHDSPALDATPAELLELWRSRPPDEQLRAARSAARAARHIAGNVCRTHRRIFEAFVELKPEVVLARDGNRRPPTPSPCIIIREWEIGAPNTPMFRDGETPDDFLGRVAEQVLRCSTVRYLHRTTLTLDGSVVVPRKATRSVHEEDERAWARLAALAVVG